MYEVLSTFKHNKKYYNKGDKVESLADSAFLLGKGLLKKLEEKKEVVKEEKKEVKKKVSKKKA